MAKSAKCRVRYRITDERWLMHDAVARMFMRCAEMEVGTTAVTVNVNGSSVGLDAAENGNKRSRRTLEGMRRPKTGMWHT